MVAHGALTSQPPSFLFCNLQGFGPLYSDPRALSLSTHAEHETGDYLLGR